MGRQAETTRGQQAWRIHELTKDFSVADVWTFRTPGSGPDAFPVMLAAMRAAGWLTKLPWPVRFLFAFRRRLGALLRWDTPSAGTGGRVASLHDRLPHDLRDGPRGTDDGMSLRPVYALHTESARELANRTVHTVMPLGWVQEADGDYGLRMAVLVKPNGWFGHHYMGAIAAFRYLLIYPALTRHWERAWRHRVGQGPDQHPGPGWSRSRDMLRWASGIMLALGTLQLFVLMVAAGGPSTAGWRGVCGQPSHS